jgi:prevent-host-death family protein
MIERATIKQAQEDFAQVVDRARRGVPTLITRHGRGAAVVVGASWYESTALTPVTTLPAWPTGSARARFGELVDRARVAGTATLITRRGYPAAVVTGCAWYERHRGDTDPSTSAPPAASEEVLKNCQLTGALRVKSA